MSFSRTQSPSDEAKMILNTNEPIEEISTLESGPTHSLQTVAVQTASTPNSTFFGLYATGTVRDSNIIEAVCEDIEDVRDKLMMYFGYEDFYQFAINFNLKNEQQRLLDFISSDYFQSYEKFWDDSLGVVHFSRRPESESVPRGKVCIIIENDKNNLPVFFEIIFKKKNIYGKVNCSIDLRDVKNEIKCVVKNKITYLNKKTIALLKTDFDSACEQLEQSPSGVDRQNVVCAFNEQWGGLFNLAYKIHRNKNLDISVNDIHNKVNLNCNSSISFIQQKPTLIFHGEIPPAITPESSRGIENAEEKNPMLYKNEIALPSPNRKLDDWKHQPKKPSSMSICKKIGMFAVPIAIAASAVVIENYLRSRNP